MHCSFFQFNSDYFNSQLTFSFFNLSHTCHHKHTHTHTHKPFHLIKDMKFLNSSSSTASSTIASTTTFDSNIHNSRSTPAGCIAGVFRRLLCLDTLPTHPSDYHFKHSDHDDSISVELDKLQCTTATNAEERLEASAMPSIVARLMGLESLPQIDISALEKSPNSIARSRSMNSVDLMTELVSIQGRHRRVKSFRESSPSFLELEDEDFFVLSFENGNESRKFERGSKQMKKNGKEESCKSKNSSRRRESVYEKNKENQAPMNFVLNRKLERLMNSRKAPQTANCDDKLQDSGSDLPRPTKNSCRKEAVKSANPITNRLESELGRRRRMEKRKDDCLPVKKIDTDQPDSENYSPNSVLDINMKFPCDPEVTSSEELSRLTNSKSRRTLTEELENYRKLNHQGIDKSLKRNDSCKPTTCSESKSCVELRKNGPRRHKNNYNTETWGEICKMAERDTIHYKWILVFNKEIQKYEEYKEISGEFEVQIFEELLEELVDHLVGNYYQNF